MAETILKLVALRSGYFGNRWNCLDFAIVLVSVIAEYSGILSIRMLRLVRSVFTLKIFSGSGNIQRDILAILESAPRIFWTMVLLLVFFYIFSIAGVSFFGEAFPEKFGNLGKSMLSLFQVTILDSWQDINLPIIRRYPFAVFYFIPFILISSFILLNIIVGIIVDATSSVARFRSKDDWFRKNYCGKKSELKDHIAKFQHYLDGFYGECAQSLIEISKDSLTDCLKEFGVVQKDIVVKNKLVQKKFRNDKWRYIYFALPGCDEKDFMIHLEWPFSIEDLALKKELFLDLHFEGKRAVDFERENHLAFEETVGDNEIERIDEEFRVSYRINVEFAETIFIDMTETERRNVLTVYYKRMEPLIQKVYSVWKSTKNKGGP